MRLNNAFVGNTRRFIGEFDLHAWKVSNLTFSEGSLVVDTVSELGPAVRCRRVYAERCTWYARRVSLCYTFFVSESVILSWRRCGVGLTTDTAEFATEGDGMTTGRLRSTERAERTGPERRGGTRHIKAF